MYFFAEVPAYVDELFHMAAKLKCVYFSAFPSKIMVRTNVKNKILDHVLV